MNRKVFVTTDGNYEVKKLSRWITIRQNYNPNKRNHLWNYVVDGYGHGSYDADFNPEEYGMYLDYFNWRGNTYAISSFYALGSVWLVGAPYFFIDTDGKQHVIGALYMDGPIFGPGLYMEIDDYGERVRLFSVEPIDK